MATYSGRIANPLQAGSRSSKLVSATTTTQSQADRTMIVLQGSLPSPVAGLRNQKTITSFKDIVTLGDVTTTTTEQFPRKLLLNTNMGVGMRRTWFTDLNFFKSITQMATPVTKILKGSTTVGIQYEPVNTAPVTAKPIRRWPREWHGENM